ncbi:MAG: hypothetical protein IMZ46_10060, partial [Acidobacteria bacterium]|nr:hypothetical protein [Acidobacteriota bacterium]
PRSPRNMRVAIREQLVLLVTFNVLVGLAVVALPTWFFGHQFVLDVRGEQLALTASLKASKITADLELVASNCRTISSRILIQDGLNDWYASRIDNTWKNARKDLEIALSSRSGTGLLQARIYTRDGSGNPDGIVNVTGGGIPRVRLPYDLPDGSPAYLGGGDDNYKNDSNEVDDNSYPSQLYPNITYDSLGVKNHENNLTEFAAFTSGNISMTDPKGVLLGPMSVNDSFALISVTLPIQDYKQPSFILGYLTILASATSLITNANSREGLGNSGLVLLLGPDNPENRFNETTKSVISSGGADEEFLDNVNIHYVLPAVSLPGQADRHRGAAYDVRDRRRFPASDYPAALRALENPPHTVNEAGSMMSTRNENGANVAVGFARTSTILADWTVLIEQTRDEAYQPINTLSKILLACVFGTAGAIFVLTYPSAHYSVLPIRRLKAATEKTVAPPGYEDGYFDSHFLGGDGATPGSGTHSSQRTAVSVKGWVGTVLSRVGMLPAPRPAPARTSAESGSRQFKIPGKVTDRRHLITDELTELTKTFNDMSDELQKQYTVLDDKVAERTRELEISKKAAEAANESKTLFIANISHELKTPLNGILGMCAVCMEEDDVDKIKQSLRTLYKSGMSYGDVVFRASIRLSTTPYPR